MNSASLMPASRKYDPKMSVTTVPSSELRDRWAQSLWLFGTATVLTESEENLVNSIIHPINAAITLTNDYFSFDKEYHEHQGMDPKVSMLNAVGLCMEWHNIGVAEAKQMVDEQVAAANRERVEAESRRNAAQRTYEEFKKSMSSLM